MMSEKSSKSDHVGSKPSMHSEVDGIRGSVDIEDSTSQAFIDVQDIFLPFPTDDDDNVLQDETDILRIRSIFVGVLLGAVVNASNVYLGLKTGLTFPASLFGSILGFAIIKTVSKAVTESFPILGGKFGPKENNIIQTSATAAGGLGTVFTSAIPALYQMELLSNPKEDYGKIACFTLGTAYVGYFFATPLRNLFIVQLARQLRLVFPTSTATATTIRSIHIASAGANEVMKKVKFLFIAFVAAFVLRTASFFATGLLWDWHIFTWFFIWGNHNNSAIFVENWAWFIEWTPAVIGSGMMVGMNTAMSMFAGTVVSWAIIGPVLVRTRAASGLLIMGEGDTGPWKDYTTYFSMSLQDPVHNPSPRYWLLWPGVLLMIVVSIAEMLCQYRVLKFAALATVQELTKAIIAGLNLVGLNSQHLAKFVAREDQHKVEEQVPDHHRIKTWMWGSGLILSIIVTAISCGLQWNVPVSITVVSVILAMIFTQVAILSTGMTNMTPLTAVSKSSQLILGGVTRNDGYALHKSQLINSIGGSIACGIASQATDLTADFRVGYLLGTPARAQWIAQGIATLAAVFLSPGIFIVFATAYPCILDLSAQSCAFAAPSVSAWRAATIASTSPSLPIPTSSGIFAICLSVFGAALVVLKHFVLTGDREKYRAYVPNMMGFGIMMVVPAPSLGIAIAMGAFIAAAWEKFWPQTHQAFLFPVVAGMIAGEGIGGVANAIMSIVGVSAGTNVACPASSC